jgi:hypothetical protein
MMRSTSSGCASLHLPKNSGRCGRRVAPGTPTPRPTNRCRKLMLRYGSEMLRPRERRQRRMPNATSPLIEQRVVAFALAHPTFGPKRVAELRRPKWGGIRISPNGTHRVLVRPGWGRGPSASGSWRATPPRRSLTLIRASLRSLNRECRPVFINSRGRENRAGGLH